jgi:hypothetical protein
VNARGPRECVRLPHQLGFFDILSGFEFDLGDTFLEARNQFPGFRLRQNTCRAQLHDAKEFVVVGEKIGILTVNRTSSLRKW